MAREGCGDQGVLVKEIVGEMSQWVGTGHLGVEDDLILRWKK
jgi:hypothetical protein